MGKTGKGFYRACGSGANGILHGSYQETFRKAWTRIFKAAKLPPEFKWHSLRHEFISQVAELTDNVQEVKELARHRNIQTTAGYMKAKEERLKELLRKRANG